MDTVKAVSGAVTGVLLLVLAAKLIGAIGEKEPADSAAAPAAASSAAGSQADSAAAAAPQEVSPEPSQPQPRPERQALPAPQPRLVPAISHDLYVASEDAEVVHYVVERPSRVKLRLAIESDVPVDVVATPGNVSREQWMMAAATGEALSILTVLSDEQAPDMFAAPLSKKAAFRVFESPWIAAEPGEYTIVLDNTRVYTPSRGDAVVKLELYSAQ